MTLSRAIQQNNELKTQIAELEGEYIKQINSNAELLNSLQHQEFVNKELKIKYNDLECRHNELYQSTKNDTRLVNETPSSTTFSENEAKEVNNNYSSEVRPNKNSNDDWNDGDEQDSVRN